MHQYLFAAVLPVLEVGLHLHAVARRAPLGSAGGAADALHEHRHERERQAGDREPKTLFNTKRRKTPRAMIDMPNRMDCRPQTSNSGHLQRVSFLVSDVFV